MKKSIMSFLVLVLPACVSSPDYGETLQNWVGVSQTALIETWGDPATINYVTPSQQLFSYFQMSPTGQEFCRTTFTITDGVVNNFEFEGDNCQLMVE